MKTARQIALALTVVFSVARLAWAHGEDDRPQGKAPEQLGEVSFPVSCNAAAQTEFNRAMALFHSFWFDPAKASFAKVLEHDPECGMAHWGIALMAMGNPFTWPSNPNAAKAGAPAAAEAQRVGAKSERERDYIAPRKPPATARQPPITTRSYRRSPPITTPNVPNSRGQRPSWRSVSPWSWLAWGFSADAWSSAVAPEI